MVAAVLVLASLLYLPSDFADVPKSALAALLFVANIWFAAQTGYFQPRAETMPLLHTWSLGVEEQFYIFFPLILLAIAVWMPRWRTAMIWLGFAVSFAICIWSARLAFAFDFFMLPARAWELMAGALLAVGAIPGVASRVGREALSWLGLAAIAFAIFTFDEKTAFPGYAALAPVLGSALLIGFAPGTTVGRLLSWRPARWIGLISYSLYLWHWPLIVFVEYHQGAPLSSIQAAMVIAAAIMISWASWRWIEGPFRDHRLMPARKIWIGSAAGMAALAAACAVLITMGDWGQRFSPEVSRMAAAVDDVSPVRKACLRTNHAVPRRECTLGAKVAADAMIWGDSHAVEFAWILGEQARREDRAIEQRTLGSCAPILGYPVQKNPDCGAFNDAVMTELAKRPEIKTVYVASYWGGRRRDLERFGSMLDRTLAKLDGLGKKVVVIGPVPTQPFFVPYELQRRAAYDLPKPTGVSVEQYLQDTAWIAERYPEWRRMGYWIVDPRPSLIEGDHMRIIYEGRPLYFDRHHLTLAGAQLVLDQESATGEAEFLLRRIR